MSDQALLLPPKKVRPLRIMGFVVLRGIRLEDGGSSSCANAEAALTAHEPQSWKPTAGVATPLVRVFTPFLGGGGTRSGLEGFAELLQWLILLLAFRSSLFQKVAGSSPALPVLAPVA